MFQACAGGGFKLCGGGGFKPCGGGGGTGTICVLFTRFVADDLVAFGFENQNSVFDSTVSGGADICIVDDFTIEAANSGNVYIGADTAQPAGSTGGTLYGYIFKLNGSPVGYWSFAGSASNTASPDTYAVTAGDTLEAVFVSWAGSPGSTRPAPGSPPTSTRSPPGVSRSATP